MLPRLFFSIIAFSILNFCTAQFPDIKWSYDVGAPAFGSAAAADLDHDGFYEIVFTTYTNDRRAHCLNAEDGSVKWIYDIGGCGDVAPVIYDMNNDGVLDVVMNGSCNPTIFCINGATGNLIWSHPSGGGDSPPTVADMDNDGLPEVLFGNFNGQIRALNGEDGSTAKIIQANPFQNAIQTAPTLVDVNNDGQLDIIAANFFNDDGLYVWAFDYETTQTIWINHMEDTSDNFHAYHGGAVADIDNDGKQEYVIGSGTGIVHAINVEDGSDHWIIAIPNSSNMSAISIADLDNDGELEIIFNNNDPVTLDERLWIYSGMDGFLEWSFSVPFTSFRGFSIGDINGNGQLDLVSGHFMGNLQVIEPYNGLLWELNLLNYFPPGLPWFEVDHQPLIADFDQNGTLDVFAVGGYGTYIPDSLNTGKAFMIEAGEGTCPEWLMFRHDIHRSGYLSSEEVELACSTTGVADNFLNDFDFSIYPNPSDGIFNIAYTLGFDTNVTIEIHNEIGHHVMDIINQKQMAGHH